MGDTASGSWTSRDLERHIKGEKEVKIEEQISAAIEAAEPDLKDGDRDLGMKEGVEKMTGLPGDFVPVLTAVVAIKNGILDEATNKKIANAMFDLVFAAATLGYVQGKRIGAGLASGGAA